MTPTTATAKTEAAQLAEQAAATRLAKEINYAADRLERLAAELRKTAQRIETTEVTSYLAEIASTQCSVISSLGSCNLDKMTYLAGDAEKAHSRR